MRNCRAHMGATQSANFGIIKCHVVMMALRWTTSGRRNHDNANSAVHSMVSSSTEPLPCTPVRLMVCRPCFHIRDLLYPLELSNTLEGQALHRADISAWYDQGGKKRRLRRTRSHPLHRPCDSDPSGKTVNVPIPVEDYAEIRGTLSRFQESGPTWQSSRTVEHVPRLQPTHVTPVQGSRWMFIAKLLTICKQRKLRRTLCLRGRCAAEFLDKACYQFDDLPRFLDPTGSRPLMNSEVFVSTAIKTSVTWNECRRRADRFSSM